jgi:hypothetical protein
MDVALRARLRDQVTEALRSDPRVADVRPAGSLAGGKADAYSDIDLVAVLRDGVADRDFFFDVPSLMATIGPSVPGWGFTALPDLYVATFHFDAYPLFWQVDVDCLSDTHVDGADLSSTYRWEQIYKTWIGAAKQTMRALDKRAEVAGLTARHVDFTMPPTSDFDELSALLDAIRLRKIERGDPYEALHARCAALLEELRTA